MTRTAVLFVLAIAAVPAMANGQTAFPVSGAACDLGKDDDRGLRTIYWELNQITEICAPVETDAPAQTIEHGCPFRSAASMSWPPLPSLELF